MKATDFLTVMGDFSLARDTLVIHPNDGFDLGFMTKTCAVKIVTGGTPADFAAGNATHVPGTVLLENACACGTMRMNLSWWKKMGSPGKVKLFCNQDILLISKT